MGSEYDYVIIARFAARESSTYNSETSKFEPSFDFSSPEQYMSLKLNEQELPLPNLLYLDNYNNDFFYWWYWNYHYYGWAIYYTNQNVLASLTNITRSPCLDEVANLFGYTYNGNYEDWYNGSGFLSDPSTKYFQISKNSLKATNNNMDLRFSSSPFTLDEWPTQNSFKTANTDVNFVVIRFKYGISECVSTKSKLKAEIRSQEFDYSSNKDGLYYWWYYFGVGASVGGAFLPGANQPYNSPNNCSWPFPKNDFFGNFWNNWNYGYDQAFSRSVDKYWGVGGHTYFDLCSYTQDSIPPCGGDLPETLNVTVTTQCLGSQSAVVSVSTPLFYEYLNEKQIPYTYTNCGNFTEIQAENFSYYMFAHVRYNQPANYQLIDQEKLFQECNLPLSSADASYFLFGKSNVSDFVDLGPVPGATEGYIYMSLFEWYLDDGIYGAPNSPPVIPDDYKDENGNIVPHSGIIGSWNIGEPITYFWWKNTEKPKLDLYSICENGQTEYKNKRDNIPYHDWPLTIRDEPIFCEPFVTGPSKASSVTFRNVSTITIVSRIEPSYSGTRYGMLGYINGELKRLKFRTHAIYGIAHLFSTNCFACEYGCRLSHPPMTVTP